MGGNSFQGDGSAVHEVADRFAKRFGDETGRAILLPLGSGHNDRVLDARKAVVEAQSEYRARRYRESLRVLDHAANLLEGSDSEFDRLWIEIARADALIWDRQLEAARMILQSVVDSSRRNNFKWLLGRALTVYGTDYRLSGSRPDMIEHLEEGIEVYESIGARGESTRARFYLANYHRFEGRTTDSLNMAHQALELVPPNDHGRQYQLLWITGSNLALRGNPKQAAAYYVEAAARAELANDPVGSAQSHIELAEIYENDSRSDLADQHIQIAEASLRKRQSTDLVASLIDVIVALGRSKILEVRGRSAEAVHLLAEKLPLLDRESIATVYSHQYRSALAKSLLGLGRKEDARKQFNLAVRAVDREDALFTRSARLAFDQRRRDVYESAIGFEFDEGNIEEAWEYAPEAGGICGSSRRDKRPSGGSWRCPPTRIHSLEGSAARLAGIQDGPGRPRVSDQARGARGERRPIPGSGQNRCAGGRTGRNISGVVSGIDRARIRPSPKYSFVLDRSRSYPAQAAVRGSAIPGRRVSAGRTPSCPDAEPGLFPQPGVAASGRSETDCDGLA
jgi:tetratricopeptide (TPR) repeat protein